MEAFFRLGRRRAKRSNRKNMEKTSHAGHAHKFFFNVSTVEHSNWKILSRSVDLDRAHQPSSTVSQFRNFDQTKRIQPCSSLLPSPLSLPAPPPSPPPSRVPPPPPSWPSSLRYVQAAQDTFYWREPRLENDVDEEHQLFSQSISFFC